MKDINLPIFNECIASLSFQKNDTNSKQEFTPVIIIWNITNNNITETCTLPSFKYSYDEPQFIFRTLNNGNFSLFFLEDMEIFSYENAQNSSQVSSFEFDLNNCSNPQKFTWKSFIEKIYEAVEIRNNEIVIFYKKDVDPITNLISIFELHGNAPNETMEISIKDAHYQFKEEAFEGYSIEQTNILFTGNNLIIPMIVKQPLEKSFISIRIFNIEEGKQKYVDLSKYGCVIDLKSALDSKTENLFICFNHSVKVHKSSLNCDEGLQTIRCLEFELGGKKGIKFLSEFKLLYPFHHYVVELSPIQSLGNIIARVKNDKYDLDTEYSKTKENVVSYLSESNDSKLTIDSYLFSEFDGYSNNIQNSSLLVNMNKKENLRSLESFIIKSETGNKLCHLLNIEKEKKKIIEYICEYIFFSAHKRDFLLSGNSMHHDSIHIDLPNNSEPKTRHSRAADSSDDLFESPIIDYEELENQNSCISDLKSSSFIFIAIEAVALALINQIF